jgi:hypothetical protein
VSELGESEGVAEERTSTGASERRGSGPAIGGVAIVVVLLVIVGGYGEHWRWVGVSGATATLWDWLHLVLLPVAALVISLWLRHRPPMTGTWAAAVGVGAAVFAVLVLAGYLVPWGWTGFVGNTLWDWLNLAALPVAVALIPVLVEVRPQSGPGHRRRRAAALAVGAAVFVAVVLAGYLVPWGWTGFTGNTAWDWLHLLLLPLLVPAVIVPLLRAVVAERFSDDRADV